MSVCQRCHPRNRFLDTSFAQRLGRIQSNATCPVRFVEENGWVETGDSGENHLSLGSNTVDISRAGTRRNGLDEDLHARNFFDSVKTRKPTAANSTVMRRSFIVMDLDYVDVPCMVGTITTGGSETCVRKAINGIELTELENEN